MVVALIVTFILLWRCGEKRTRARKGEAEESVKEAVGKRERKSCRDVEGTAGIESLPMENMGRDMDEGGKVGGLVNAKESGGGW